MRNRIKKCIKIVAFLLPLVMISLPFLLSGEQLTGGDLARLQQAYHQPMLYGPLSESQFRFYKAESARIVRPSVLVLGASRTLQIRRFFFTKDVKMYNAGQAGGATKNAADMHYFLQSQDADQIDMLIMVLDQFAFNVDAWGPIEYPTHQDYMVENPVPLNIPAQMDFMRSKNAAKGTLVSANLFDLRIIGQNAKYNLFGMLNDGSFFYGALYDQMASKQNVEKRMEDVLRQVENAEEKFAHGQHVYPEAVAYLKQLLQYCKDHNIYVIAYVPPYAPMVGSALKEKGDAYAYQEEMLEIVPQVYNDFGFEFFNYLDTSFLGCTDDYFFDGLHASDVVFLRMFIDMIQQGSRLGEYCSIDELKAYDRDRVSNLQLLGTWEQYNEWAMQNH